jgi:hypothetical protein
MTDLALDICPFSGVPSDAPELPHEEASLSDDCSAAVPHCNVPSICQFYRLIPGAPEPRRADRSADGTLPTNGFRYCEPVTAASGFGWYLYPPCNFRLIWSGDEVAVAFGRSKRYTSLRGMQYPGFRKIFAEIAPDGIKDMPPPFLTQGLLPGAVQIWSGYVARTSPGWALLSRGVVNKPKTQPFENVEGIFETSMWFGPLFTNIQIRRTNSPIEFHQRYPMFQVLPVRRECYRDPSFDVLEADDLTADDWLKFRKTIEPNTNSMRKLGHHAVAVRKERRNAV